MKHQKYSKQAQDEREQSKAIWSLIMGLAAVCVVALSVMASAGMIE